MTLTDRYVGSAFAISASRWSRDRTRRRSRSSAALLIAPSQAARSKDMKPDGSARLVGRRNVHTGELEKVEGWGE